MTLLSYQEIHNWNLDYLIIYVKILQFLENNRIWMWIAYWQLKKDRVSKIRIF